jgi:rubrerythrin
MSLLKTEPVDSIRSMDELFAVAHAMEHEAAARYNDIARRMRADGNASLADVFEHLADEERSHVDSVVHWSRKERGHAPDPALVRWQLPETFDDEGAAVTDPRLLTAYRALSMAVRNEERAFAFWSYVAAHAATADIRRAAETMAREELEHVAILRRERRQAYRAERPDSRRQDVSADPALLELRLADKLERLAGADAPRAARIRRLADDARRNAEDLTREPRLLSRAAPLPREIPDDPLLLSEVLADRYLEAAEHVADEAALAVAQLLAARAVQRLAWLREDLPELHV